MVTIPIDGMRDRRPHPAIASDRNGMFATLRCLAVISTFHAAYSFSSLWIHKGRALGRVADVLSDGQTFFGSIGVSPVLMTPKTQNCSRACKIRRLWCPGAESNHRHGDFQSSASLFSTDARDHLGADSTGLNAFSSIVMSDGGAQISV
jgi:hypothetical protein